MKKIILLLIVLFSLNTNVSAYDRTDQFYYDDEQVKEMWITSTDGKANISVNPYMFKRRMDNAYVYCLEPLVLIKQNTNYEGHYNLNSKFKLSESEIERIRLVTYFGYMYPGHEDIKWYGITQYLIWDSLVDDVDVYFADAKNGKRINAYQKEIVEIESLIENYKELLLLDGSKFQIHNYDEFESFRASNVFLRDILYIDSQTIDIPINELAKNEEMFYYHADGQNFYLLGSNTMSNISIEFEFLQEFTIRKWYGDSEYELEDGAEFEIYLDGELVKTVITDEFGLASFYLPYGRYWVTQAKGIEGYYFVDPFEISIDMFRSSNMVDLYDELITLEEFPVEMIKVPDTAKNKPFIHVLFMPLLFWVLKHAR